MAGRRTYRLLGSSSAFETTVCPIVALTRALAFIFKRSMEQKQCGFRRCYVILQLNRIFRSNPRRFLFFFYFKRTTCFGRKGPSSGINNKNTPTPYCKP